MSHPDCFTPIIERIAKGQPAMGFGLNSTSLRAAETLCGVGGDFLCIDMQHGEAELNNLPAMCNTIAMAGLPCIVRTASQDSVLIQRCLDLGADALIVPYVNSVAEARAIACAAKYPPQGERSFGPLRTARSNSAYLKRANEAHPVFVMLETRQAIDQATEILAVNGIAGGTIGPGDLSISMGHDPFAASLHDDVDEAIAHAGQAALKTGKIAGGFFGLISPERLEQRVKQGYRLFMFGHEFRMMARTGQQLLASLGRG